MKRSCLLLLSVLLTFLLMTSCSASYDVTFVLSDGESVTATVDKTSDLFIPVAPEGHVFAGWYSDSDFTRPVLSASDITANTTLYAHFVERGEYTVTYVWGNGNANTTLITEGTLVRPDDPVREMFSFTGWYTDEALSQEYDFSLPLDSDLVLFAGWEYNSKPLLTLVCGIDGEQVTYTVDWGFRLKDYSVPVYDGYSFAGWYNDADMTSPVTSDYTVTSDITLYGRYIPGEYELGNLVVSEILTSTVRIYNYAYNSGFMGMVTDSIAYTGSGVIFTESNGYYYAVTNYHVIDKSGYSHAEYTVYDAFGAEYRATLIAADEAYDLAVLRFAKSAELSVATVSTENEAVGMTVVAVGNPNGLLNTVTYGILLSYYDAGGDGLDFEVGCHNAPIDHGSSGGGVFNTQGRLVGINYAGGDSEDGISYSFLIPITDVITFLSNNGFTLL